MAAKSKKLRIAVIGNGNICQEHMPALREIPEAEVVAGVDLKQECLDRMNTKFGVDKKALYKDWNKMLEAVKPDAVDICLPNDFHCPCALDAFKAGCHVFVEKPMAMNAKECDLMLAAAKKAKKKIAVGYQQEYNPATVIIKNAADAGFFGNIRNVHGKLLRRRGTPGYGTFFSRAHGGGPIMDIATHLLDVITYVMGRPKPVRVSGQYFFGMGNKPNKVYCGFQNWNYKEDDVEDEAIFQVIFEHGEILQLETSYCTHIEKDLYYEFSMTGDKGGCDWCPMTYPKLYNDQFGAMMNMTPTWLPSLGRPDMFRNKLNNFVQSVLKGSDLRIPGEDGRYSMEILDAVAEAVKKQKEIVLK